MSLGLPSISITFKSVANKTSQLGIRGIVALILKDATHNGANIYTTAKDVQSDLSETNQEQIKLALIGGLNADDTPAVPQKVIAFIEPADAADYSAAMTYFGGVKWDYLAVPGIAASDVTAVATWVEALRDQQHKRVKAVLPNSASDHEGIINFATDGIKVDDTTYSAADYCARIAGILAGIPLTIASTYQVLPEVTSIPVETDDQLNADIAAGKLILFTDVDKIRIARGVNSLTTLTAGKGADFQKIKLVAIMDRIYSDIEQTAHNSYIGKVPNDYDHKCILVSAINSYLAILAQNSILDPNATNAIEIDTDAQKEWLTGQGVDTGSIKELQIKEYNTGTNVFLKGDITPVDAMEDISLSFTLGV